MTKVFIHADDFGVTIEQSKSIIECAQKGALNSISIIMNSPYAIASYDELIRGATLQHSLRAVVHLNFVEGRPCADSNRLPLLTDERGMFNCTYGKILKASFFSDKATRKNYKEQFKLEIAAQLAAASALLSTKHLSIDSHQHYHMIPVVYEALMEVINENGYSIDYLRVPVDPAGPIWSTPGMLFKMPPVNFIKWTLLKLLSTKCQLIHNSRFSSVLASHGSLVPYKKSLSIPIFFGMPFTCQMEKGLVDDRLYKKYLAYAQKKERDLELMFHPGAVNDASDLLDSTQQDLVDFYSSEHRLAEKNTIETKKFLG